MIGMLESATDGLQFKNKLTHQRPHLICFTCEKRNKRTQACADVLDESWTGYTAIQSLVHVTAGRVLTVNPAQPVGDATAKAEDGCDAGDASICIHTKTATIQFLQVATNDSF